jgi:prephenate dehydratase
VGRAGDDGDPLTPVTPGAGWEPDPIAGVLLEPEPAPLAAVETVAIRVAFQGEPGAFSEQAIVQLWRGAAEPVPMRSFEDVADAAERRVVEYGMLPIESTLVGGVDVAYDLLAMHDGLYVVGETVVPIRLGVLAIPGATIDGLTTLASHPIMLAQCTHFLDAHRHITAEPCWDTAGAAREVMERGDPTRAAAAGPYAGERFGLVTLKPRIEDRPDTMMRFLAVGTEPATLERGVPARTAVLCTLPNSAGALLAIIQPLAKAGLNVSHLTSRPTREPWKYQFYVEFDHEAHDRTADQALRAVRKACTEVRLLGTFPRWNVAGEGG